MSLPVWFGELNKEDAAAFFDKLLREVSYSETADWLKGKGYSSATPDGVKKFKHWWFLSVSDFIKARTEYRRKFADIFLDSVDLMYRSMLRVEERIDELEVIMRERRDDVKLHSVLQGYMREMREWTKINMQRLGELKESVVNAKEVNVVNLTQINFEIQDAMCDLVELQGEVEDDEWIRLRSPEIVEKIKKRRKKVKIQ